MRPFRLLHELSLLPKPNPWKGLLPGGRQPFDCFKKHSIPVASSSSVTVTSWPLATCDPLLEQKETGGNGWEDRMNNGKKDKTLDSGGNQRQVEEINIFVPSKIDYALAAGIDMCQRSLLLQSRTNSHMVAL